MMMHMRDPLPNMYHLRPEVPEELIAVIARALAKEPDDRYASMAELAGALNGALNNLQPSVVAPAALVGETPEPGSPGTLAGEATVVESPVSPDPELGDKTLPEEQAAGAAAAIGLASRSSAPGQGAAAGVSPAMPSSLWGMVGSRRSVIRFTGL